MTFKPNPMKRIERARNFMVETLQVVDQSIQPGKVISSDDMRAIFHNIAEAVYEVCDAIIETRETGL